jgi:hypothetical protein
MQMNKMIHRIASFILTLATALASYSSAQAARGGADDLSTTTEQPNQQAAFYKHLAPNESSGWSIDTSGYLEKVTAVPDGWICEAGGYTAFTHFARLRYKVPEQAGMVLTTFYMKMVVVLPADFYAQQMVGFRLMTTDNYTTTLNGAPVGANDVNETRASVYINSDHSLRVKVEHETISSKMLYVSQSPLPVGEHTLELFGSLNVVAPWYLRIDGTVVASGMEMLSMSDTTPNERVATRLATGILGAAGQNTNSMNLQVKSFEIANYDMAGVAHPSLDLFQRWAVSDHVRTMGDVNGDGKDDLVGFGQDGAYVALSDGNSFGSIGKWTNAFGLSAGWTVRDYVRTVGDVNGDGMDDLVGFGQNGVWVSLSTGSGFPTPTRWVQAFDLAHGWTVQDYVRTLADVNGDGKDDLVGFGQNGVWVSLSTGSSFPAPTRWVQAFDLAHGWTVQDYVRTLADVNGDGKDDLVGFGQNGVWVSLSTGSGFPAPSKWTSSFDLSHGWTVSQYVRMVSDVNGDGKDDLVGFGHNGVYLALSNGSGVDPIRPWKNDFGLADGWTVRDFVRTIGDINGDGTLEVVSFGPNGVYLER